jgi:hypothetical protein
MHFRVPFVFAVKIALPDMLWLSLYYFGQKAFTFLVNTRFDDYPFGDQKSNQNALKEP